MLIAVEIKDGIKHTTNQANANVLNQYFSAFTHDGKTTLPDMGSSPYPNLPDIDINIAGLLKLLNQLDLTAFLQNCCMKWLKNSLKVKL